MPSKRLSDNDFIQLIDHAPLISIDLIIKNEKDEVLLGYRNNSPARNTWFVPGGRILKNQTLDEAFESITFQELGIPVKRTEAVFHRVAEHLYPNDNNFNIQGIDTHYIVLSYIIGNMNHSIEPADAQHRQFRWFSINEILDSPDVHKNTKDYFR